MIRYTPSHLRHGRARINFSENIALQRFGRCSAGVSLAGETPVPRHPTGFAQPHHSPGKGRKREPLLLTGAEVP